MIRHYTEFAPTFSLENILYTGRNAGQRHDSSNEMNKE